jgi:hypothetical protein
MQDATKTRWVDVCAQAAICDVPERLEELAQEIVSILRTEQQIIANRKNRTAHTAA